ncbi:MAG TPA: hypothetical protein VKJ01_16700, partial [Candidatus Solibacter sp.]|nr:hypothetical protein [Candidatus Solibacter sp.]
MPGPSTGREACPTLLHCYTGRKGMAANTASMGMNISELAEQRGVRECLQWFTREKQWINEAHLQLCRVPAP